MAGRDGGQDRDVMAVLDAGIGQRVDRVEDIRDPHLTTPPLLARTAERSGPRSDDPIQRSGPCRRPTVRAAADVPIHYGLAVFARDTGPPTSGVGDTTDPRRTLAVGP